MLVLTRKQGESIRIGDNIEIVITEINKGSIRLGIHAPKDLSVYRTEIYERILKENMAAADLTRNHNDLSQLNMLVTNKLKAKQV